MVPQPTWTLALSESSHRPSHGRRVRATAVRRRLCLRARPPLVVLLSSTSCPRDRRDRATRRSARRPRRTAGTPTSVGCRPRDRSRSLLADAPEPHDAVAVLFGTCEPGVTVYEHLIEPSAGNREPRALPAAAVDHGTRERVGDVDPRDRHAAAVGDGDRAGDRVGLHLRVGDRHLPGERAVPAVRQVRATRCRRTSRRTPRRPSPACRSPSCAGSSTCRVAVFSTVRFGVGAFLRVEAELDVADLRGLSAVVERRRQSRVRLDRSVVVVDVGEVAALDDDGHDLDRGCSSSSQLIESGLDATCGDANSSARSPRPRAGFRRS